MTLNQEKMKRFFDSCHEAHIQYSEGLLDLSAYLDHISGFGYSCRGVSDLGQYGLALCICHVDDSVFEPNTDFFIPLVVLEDFETNALNKYVH